MSDIRSKKNATKNNKINKASKIRKMLTIKT